MFSEEELNTIETVHKELEMIENVITRMANNSFMIKGWCITLFIALITFFNVKDLSSTLLIFILALIIFLFGYLDAYYLLMERKYTALYSHIKKEHLAGHKDNLFDLDAENFNRECIISVILNFKYVKKFYKKYSENYNKILVAIGAFITAQLRNTILIFYGSLILFIMLYASYSNSRLLENEKSIQNIACELTLTNDEIKISEENELYVSIAERLTEINDNMLDCNKINTKQNEEIKNVLNEISTVQEKLSEIDNKLSENR